MQPPLRIALISEHASPVALLGGADAGGQNVYVDELSRALARLGHRVDVLTRRDDPCAPQYVQWAPGVRVVHVDAGPPEQVPKDTLWTSMPAFRDEVVRLWLQEGEHPNIVHGNFWMSGWVAAELRRLVRVPAVQTFHALGATKRHHQGHADTSPPARIAVEKQVVRDINRVVAQCPHEIDELVGDYGADPRKIALIPGGVNTERFRPADRAEARRALGLAPEVPLIVYVGRMLPRKDVRNVVRALTLLATRWAGPRSPNLLVVGGETAEPDPAATPEIGEVRRLAGELGVGELVTFTGRRQPDELRLYYSAADVAVTTPWYEPFGLTPLEAMACGVPVVGSAVGGIPHTVEDGVAGLLVPPRDPEALATALGMLLARPRLRDQMGRAGLARVHREFTWPLTALRMERLYRSILGALSDVPRDLVAAARDLPTS
jgi:glycosyltransferase involved in cell wall biosynthesis